MSTEVKFTLPTGADPKKWAVTWSNIVDPLFVPRDKPPFKITLVANPKKKAKKKK